MAWQTRRVQFDEVARLAEALGCPEPMAWVLVRRGLADPQVAREFLASDGPLSPPESIPGIAEAADRLAQAVTRGERIVVHGDYDCDGICSTAIVVQALQVRGGRVSAFLPSRFTDGYGVNVATVERLAEEGCQVLVTVDCGTSAVEALTVAADLGIDTIVADHHLAGGHRPPGIIANPALGHGRDDLPAAAGVAFKLTQALAARLDGDRLAPAMDEGIDLVALATVADAVPLIGENRRLVARGLAAIHANPRPGIAALCAAASISPRSATARDLGWNLAPAINASGRMDHPMRALELLLAEDGPQTTLQARALWDLNMERRAVEQQVTQEAISIVEASPPEIRDAHALVVAGEGWHEGVVGIVASRLVERFSRPAIVVSITPEVAKGSGRSLPGVDLHSLVGASASRLQRWGGHAGAVGLQLAHDDIHHFRAELAQAAASVQAAIHRAQVRTVDAVVGISDLSLASAEAFDAMQPFGTANPEVRMVVPGALIEQVGTVGKDRQHLQVRLRAGSAHARAMGWRQGARAERTAVGARVDAIVELGIERWQDMVGPRVTLNALDPLEPAPAVTAQCTTGCDASCPARRMLSGPQDCVPAAAAAQPASGTPRTVRDRRGTGRVLAEIVSLAGADAGVVVVVADVAHRRGLLDTVLAPARMGIDVAVFAGERCERTALAARLALVRGRPSVILTDYQSLADLAIADDQHVAVVDPPADSVDLARLRAAANDRRLHLIFGEPEVDNARQLAHERWDVRTGAAAVWRATQGRERVDWDTISNLRPAEDAPTFPRARIARALAALTEIGRVEITASGVLAIMDAPAANLAETPTATGAAARLADQLDFLGRAMTLQF